MRNRGLRQRLQLCVIGLALSTLFPITGAWALQATPTSLTFTGAQGGANPSSQAVSFSKNNRRPLSWTSSDNASWLNVTPASGALTQAAQIIVSVNTTGLSAGAYTATVTIIVNKGGSLALPVTLLITPAAPTTSLSSTGTTATLTWSTNAETDLAGYKVYMGNAPGAYGPAISLGKVTSYVISNLQVGNTYYFVITAYDTSGNESLPSTVVSKSIY